MNIPNFPGYFIYSSGNVIGKSGRLLTLHKDDKTRPYPYVSLCKDKRVHHKMIHKLLAECFIPNPENKPEVNHKDGNKLNYSLDNLEWATQLENLEHSIINNLTHNQGGELARNVKLTKEQVGQIKELYLEYINQCNLRGVTRIRGYCFLTKTAEMFSVERSTIHKIVKGKLWKEMEDEK